MKILKTGSGEIVQGLKHIPQPCGHLDITRCSPGGLKYQRVQLIPYSSTKLLVELAELSQYVGPQVLEVAIGDPKLPLLNKKCLNNGRQFLQPCQLVNGGGSLPSCLFQTGGNFGVVDGISGPYTETILSAHDT